MRYENQSAAASNEFNGLYDFGFGAVVESARGFIKNQKLDVTIERTG